MCSTNTLEVPALEASQSRKSRTNKLSHIYLVCITILHVSILVHGIFVHGPCWDEVGHLPAGLSHWRTGRFDLYRVNPPLARTIATLPLAYHNIDIPWQWNPVYTADRPEWEIGKKLIEKYGAGYLRLLRISRLACIPFSLLAIWVTWNWSKSLFGEIGAMLSVTVWALSPLVLTNAQMITPDTAAAAVGGLACYRIRNWLFRRTPFNAFLGGLTLGLAELTKFT